MDGRMEIQKSFIEGFLRQSMVGFIEGFVIHERMDGWTDGRTDGWNSPIVC